MPVLPKAAAASAAAAVQAEQHISNLLRHAGLETQISPGQIALIAEHGLGQFIAEHITVEHNYCDPQLLALFEDITHNKRDRHHRRSQSTATAGSRASSRRTTATSVDDGGCSDPNVGSCSDSSTDDGQGDEDLLSISDQDAFRPAGSLGLPSIAGASKGPTAGTDAASGRDSGTESLRARVAARERQNAALEGRVQQMRTVVSHLAGATRASHHSTQASRASVSHLSQRRDTVLPQLEAEGRQLHMRLEALASSVEELGALVGQEPASWLLAANLDAYAHENSKLEREMGRMMEQQQPPRGARHNLYPEATASASLGSSSSSLLQTAACGIGIGAAVQHDNSNTARRLTNPFLPTSQVNNSASVSQPWKQSDELERLRLAFLLSEQEDLTACLDVAETEGELAAVQQMAAEAHHHHRSAAMQQQQGGDRRDMRNMELQAEADRLMETEVAPLLDRMARRQDVHVLLADYELQRVQLSRDLDRLRCLLEELLHQRARHALLAALCEGEDAQLRALYEMVDGLRAQIVGTTAAAAARCARYSHEPARAASGVADRNALGGRLLSALLEAAPQEIQAGAAAAAAVPLATAIPMAAVPPAALQKVAAHVVGSVHQSIVATDAELVRLSETSVPACVTAVAAAAVAAKRHVFAPAPATAATAAAGTGSVAAAASTAVVSNGSESAAPMVGVFGRIAATTTATVTTTTATAATAAAAAATPGMAALGREEVVEMSLPALQAVMSELRAEGEALQNEEVVPLVEQYHSYQAVMTARRELSDVERGVLISFWTAPERLSRQVAELSNKLEALRRC